MTISIDILILAACVAIATFATFVVTDRLCKYDWTAVTKLTGASFGTGVFMLIAYMLMSEVLDWALGIFW